MQSTQANRFMRVLGDLIQASKSDQEWPRSLTRVWSFSTLIPALLLSRVTAYALDMDGSARAGYLRWVAGLALLSSVGHHLLPFLHGVGANGKGVLMP
jgi:hypothetical protein